MKTYRIEVNYCQGYLLGQGRRNAVYAVYPHCSVSRLEDVNSIVLNYQGALYGGWDLKTLVNKLKIHTRRK